MAGFAAKVVRAILDAQGVKADVATVRRLELHIREQFGGERFYIGKPTSLGKAARLAAAVAGGQSPERAIRQARISRAWGFRLFSRRWGDWDR